MSPKDLSFGRLCAGSYEANASILTKYPCPEQTLPIILSSYLETKGRFKSRRFIAIDFTNWNNKRCRLTIPVKAALFNLVTDETVYIALHDLEKHGKITLYIATEASVASNFSSYTCIDTKAQGVELMETPPSIVRLEPVNLRDVTNNLIILRECTNSSEDLLAFFQDIERASDQIQVVQKALAPRMWDPEPERKALQQDIRQEQRSPTKKSQIGSKISGSPLRNEKRATDFSSESDSNLASAPKKPSRTRPPRKRRSLGLGNKPDFSQEASPKTNDNRTDETQRQGSNVKLNVGQNSRGRGNSFSGRGSRAGKGNRGGKRGNSNKRIVSEPAHGKPAAKIETFEDHNPGNGRTGVTQLTNNTNYQSALTDQQLPEIENLNTGNNRGGFHRGGSQQGSTQRGNFQQGNVPRGNIQRGNVQRGNAQRGNFQQGFRGRGGRGSGRGFRGRGF
ncbi:hypothetical protein TWF106_004662 [Orbilia oligospora]|uniref:Uncharacterized protein n=1 Tax=Orbilia oligospora TaxID=2813651 RepID=A0A7C8UU01_ORBOL|nr:hypothetical protein TWF679_010452 [Orbilia oligospora]KAF3224017.1 hypothetical protein TWF106_004662 [Orbilia oligospora]